MKTVTSRPKDSLVVRGNALQGCLTYFNERIIRKRQREPSKSLFARMSLVPIPIRVPVYSARRHLLRGGFRVSSWPRLPLRRKLVREAAEGSQRVISEWQAREVIKGGLLRRCRPLLAESRFCFCRRRCHPPPEISTTGCDPSGVAKFVWWLVATRVTALLRIRQK